jgi:hypothetical protein
VTDQARVDRLAQAYRAEYRLNWRLYEFSVDTAMVARRAEGGGPSATATEIWRDTAAG